MNNEEYLAWDYMNPGISFNMTYGRITIFKTSLKMLGMPEYIHFMCSMDRKMFAIEPCELDDPGSHRLWGTRSRDSCDVKCKILVRFVFQGCGWKENSTYRISGELNPEKHRLEFDLSKSFEIVEGRMKSSELHG